MLINIFRGDRRSRSAFTLRNYLREQGVSCNVFRLMTREWSEHSTVLTRADMVVNWGCSRGPRFKSPHVYVPPGPHPSRIYDARVFNGSWGDVEDCVNKREFYDRVTAIPESFTHLRLPFDTPPHTTDIDTAEGWQGDGLRVLARHTLTGYGGAGIQLCDPDEPLPAAPLYVQYIKKSLEYRLHIVQPMYGRPELLHWQQKMRRRGHEEPNNQIRNHENGWIYATGEGTSPPSDVVVETATRVMSAFPELNYGALDIGFNRYYDRATVYEINTAPGLCGTTVEVLGNYLQSLVSN